MVLNGYSDEYPLEDNQPNHSDEDFVLEEMRSWKNFSDALKYDDRKLFEQMISAVLEFKDGIASKGSLFKSEGLIMALILLQQRMIRELINQKENPD